MPCIVCNDEASSLYTAAGGAMLVDVCLKHAAELPGIRPLALASQCCRNCSCVAKCCRTREATP